MLVYIWLAVAMAALWLFFNQKPSRYNQHGVKNSSSMENIGNTLWVMMGREHFADEQDRTYKKFPGQRFIGRSQFSLSVVLLKDIELMKKITVKDFEHFIDHKSIITEEHDPLIGRSLVSLRGQEWKDMRSTLSPAFTSSKIRLMLPFMAEAGKQMIETLKMKIKESKNDYIDIDAKDLTTRYANDVIASCAFGLNVNSHAEENNQFYMMGKKAANMTGILTLIKFLLFVIMPKLMTKLKITLFPEDLRRFFRNMVIETMKDREERNIIRPDMIHLLMEAKKGKLLHEDKGKDADAGFATVEESIVGKKNVNREWSENDLIAQAFIFFFAGFETVSTAMSFVLQELAVNPDVQDKLFQEIRETDAKNDGKFDYNSIQSMTYMDMVISEVLRLWPPAVQLERLCVKDYNLGKASDDPACKDYIMLAGESVFIPVYSIHRDPEFYPDPQKFDPERFSEENKHNIKPFSYLPFGVGPRNCIGSRFALCEVKVMVYQLLLQMEVVPNEKTCIPTQLDPKAFNFAVKGGHWLRLKIRS